MADKKRRKAKKSAKIQLAETMFVSEAEHEHLLQYIKKRLDFAKPFRDALADRYEVIDRELAGFIRLDTDDSRRERDNRLGKGPKVVDTVLPLIVVQLDEAITYLMSLLAPDDGMYSAIAVAAKQDVAKGFSLLMNKNDKIFEHYRHYALAILNMLRYNLGGLTVHWEEIIGNVIGNTETQEPQIESQVVFAGNSVTAFDPYNTLLDPAVDAVDMPLKGEFFATVKLMTVFRLRIEEQNNNIFGIERFIDELPRGSVAYWRAKPTIRAFDPASSSGGESSGTDFVNILSMGQDKEVNAGFEIVKAYMWLNPSEFGLSDINEYQIWKFTIVGAKHIIAAEFQSNAHGYLPIAIGRPWEDGFESQTKSYAEILTPFQRFASFQINVHQRAARKALYGVTVYNRRLFPDLDNVDLTAAKIPANPSAMDMDLRRAFVQFNDSPQTDNTLRDISVSGDLMQRVLPTDQLRQVADLERATRYQAAATVQASNRRNHKMAKIADSQCFTKIRHMQMYNILQFQEVVEILNENGELQEINPAQFRGAGLEFDIADGLKGIDKLSITEGMRETINMILQNQEMAQEMDIIAMIDYLTTLQGDKTDFKQFRKKTGFSKLTTEQKEQAFQLLQQAAAQQQQQQGQR